MLSALLCHLKKWRREKGGGRKKEEERRVRVHERERICCQLILSLNLLYIDQVSREERKGAPIVSLTLLELASRRAG